MTAEPRTALAPVRLIPRGQQGKLTTPEGGKVPVRVFEQGRDALMLVMLLANDSGIDPEPVEPMLLEYTSAHGLVRVRGEALLEGRDLIRFQAEEPPEVLQRREFVRIESAQPVVLRQGEDQATLETHAVDVSGGGMLLGGAHGLELGATVRFVLDLGSDHAPIEGRARVVRCSEEGLCGLVFEEVSSVERQRLIHFIFDRQRAALAQTRDGTARTRRAR